MWPERTPSLLYLRNQEGGVVGEPLQTRACQRVPVPWESQAEDQPLLCPLTVLSALPGSLWP